MNFNSVDEAIRVLENMAASEEDHQAAIGYLAGLDERFKIESLVNALQSKHLGVRWEAGKLLARKGWDALPAILTVLSDPKRVGDPILREGVLHMLHTIKDHELQKAVAPLINALKSPAADIATLQEADLLIKKMNLKNSQEE